METAASFDFAATIARLGFPVLTVLVLAALALILSSYVKIVTVLAVLRAGLGVQGLPTAMVTGGLAVALSFFVMFPTIHDAASSMDAVVKNKPAATDADRAAALNAAAGEWKKFLLKHADAEEAERFAGLARDLERSRGREIAPDVKESWQVLAPAFLVSELKSAFKTGLNLFVPLLIIDLVIASLLAALGVELLSPYLVALPFKLFLFIAVDGWSLITTNLVKTYLS